VVAVFKGLGNLFSGDPSEKTRTKYQDRVNAINALEPSMQALSNEELRAKTDEFRRRVADGASVDDLLEEAFAVVREASKRVLGLRPFDVQLIGGMILHEGQIAEMKTGEGKTLVATLPSYVNALTGKGVHVVTVNDYLARRDSEWVGQVHKFLGLEVGLVQQGLVVSHFFYSADANLPTVRVEVKPERMLIPWYRILVSRSFQIFIIIY